MFDETNFKIAVKLLCKYALDVNKAQMVSELMEHHSLGQINYWLREVSKSDNPEQALDVIEVSGKTCYEGLAVENRIKEAERINNLRREKMLRNDQSSVSVVVKNRTIPSNSSYYDLKPMMYRGEISDTVGTRDDSGLEGRYSLAIDFKELYDDPNVFYGTWEETPPARRRFR